MDAGTVPNLTLGAPCNRRDSGVLRLVFPVHNRDSPEACPPRTTSTELLLLLATLSPTPRLLAAGEQLTGFGTTTDNVTTRLFLFTGFSVALSLRNSW